MSVVSWASFNAETYERVGKVPLSTEYRCKLEKGAFRIGLVSLFSVENLGTRALYPFMKEAGFDIDLIFLKEHALNNFKMPSETEVRLFIDLLRQRQIKLVGFGARSPYVAFLRDLTKRIHDELHIPVVWAGTVGTVTPEVCLNAGADYAICDAGEEAFAEFVNAVGFGEDPRHILNLWYRDGDGKPVGNALRKIIADLDRLPIQNLEDDDKFFIEFNKLTEGDPWRSTIKFETLTARGCPYVCSFCIHSKLVEMHKGLGKAVNGYSVEHAVREIEYARAKLPNMKCLFFADEVFGVGIEWVREFEKKWIERVNLPFECMIEPRALSTEKLRLLKNAGMVELNIGIQSGSEKLRAELYDRPMSNKDLLKVVQWAHEAGVNMRYDIICDSPFETPEDKRATLDVLLELPRPFILNMYSLNYFPGAKLTEYALKIGLIDESQVAGLTDVCLEQFTVSLDFPRPTDDTFWNALYAMSSKWFIPKTFLRYLADLRWPKRHPAPVVALARITGMARLFFDGLRLLWQGRISFDTIRRYSGSIGSLAR